jgi:hypothetical protein
MQKASIFISSKPIDAQNFEVYNMKSLFKPGQKIYYILLNPKPFVSGKIRLQILKVDYKGNFFGVTIAQGRDIEIDKNKQYISGDFVLHQNGYYALRIFADEIYAYPLAETHFQVDDNAEFN